jgi:hypothetical protein
VIRPWSCYTKWQKTPEVSSTTSLWIT